MAHEVDELGEDEGSRTVTRRIYDRPLRTDGYRVLVDRLWPRGITKAKAALDEWAKDLAPSDELRKAYHGEAINWSEFRKRYRAELKRHAAGLKALKHRAGSRRLTLLYGSRDPVNNHAAVLAQALETSRRAKR